MSWWIGTYFDRAVPLVDAVWVEAEPEAAQEVVDWLGSEDGIAARGGKDVVELDHVFVVNADERTVYDVVSRVEPSKLQCCGGNAWTEDGHSGHRLETGAAE